MIYDFTTEEVGNLLYTVERVVPDDVDSLYESVGQAVNEWNGMGRIGRFVYHAYTIHVHNHDKPVGDILVYIRDNYGPYLSLLFEVKSSRVHKDITRYAKDVFMDTITTIEYSILVGVIHSLIK